MKDAKGHGSDAHSAGVQSVGQARPFQWVKIGRSHVLTNADQTHGPAIGEQVGNVEQIKTRPGTGNATNQYIGRYNYTRSTGNAPSGYSHHGSVQGAKKYVESQLSRFWEPPNVKNNGS